MTSPVKSPEAYDTFVLAGIESPGQCKFSMPVRDEGWDQQQGKSGSPGETVHNGPKGMAFDVELYLWEDPATGIDYFAEYESFIQVLKTPTKKGASKALDIYHPQLEGLGITSVVVKSWSQPQPDGMGGGTAKISFLEYLPSKPKGAGGKPKGSKSSDKGDPPDPNQDLKDELDSLTEEYQSL